jgi:hypothetical protein
MTTIAATHTRAVFPAIKPTYPSAVLSGIVPDQSHLDDGGYHVSLDDLKRYGNLGDYSSTRTLDKSPPVTATGRRYACAIDISLSRTDMVTMYGHVERAWRNRATDTRTKYVNAINVWSGEAGVRPVRFNFQQGTRANASKDHEWHAHGDWVRVYVDDAYSALSAERAARAFVSILIGQTHDQWQRQEQLGPYAPKPPAATQPANPAPAPAPAPEDDDDMITQTYQLPTAYAYDPAGKVLDPAAVRMIGTPPAGLKTHRWGADYKLFVSVIGDHIAADTVVRVAINDGKSWHVSYVKLAPGVDGRVAVKVPAPATDSAYAISAGLCTPKVDSGAELPAPAAALGVVVEMLRN